jgi:hypothetical protein
MKQIEISKLQIGEKIEFGKYGDSPLIWVVADQNHGGFPADTVTIVSERTIGNTTFAPADPINKDHDRRLYGNNRYKDSFIRNYLNSIRFMEAIFNEKEINAIAETEVKTKQPEVDGQGIDLTTDRLFLLSASEVGLAQKDEEGSLVELFSDHLFRRVQDIDGDWDWWWLRSAYVSNSYLVRLVFTGGSADNNYAYSGRDGVRPACNLLSGYLVSSSQKQGGA